jgi:hypothetical protein
MTPGSTVDDPEVAAMVALNSDGLFFFSGGGFSNIFTSDLLLLFDILTQTLIRTISQVT